MKPKNCFLAGVSAVALAAVAADAQSSAPNPYVTTTQMYVWPGYTGVPAEQAGNGYFNFDMGGVLQQDLIIRSAGQSLPIDPGFGGNFSFGYNFTDALAAEFQTGFNESGIDTSSSQAAVFSGFSADMYQIPVMGNVIFRVPIPGGLTPYVGAGYGGVSTTLETWHRGYYRSDSDFTPAYQVLAGVKVTLNHHTEVGVGYRFLATTAHTWFADSPTLYTATGPTFAHYITATITVSF